jgi:ribA/ribD-fused uncharacterized protein
MTIFYHGAHALIEKFTKSCAGSQGFKCGYGVYVTSVHSFAAQCSNDTNGDHYVYAVEIPEKTDTNHIAYKQPVHESIVQAVQKTLGVVLSSEAAADGWEFKTALEKHFREGRKTFTLKDAKKVTDALLAVGVEMIEWPYVWTDSSQGVNVTVLDASKVKIKSVEKVHNGTPDAEECTNTHSVAHLIKKYYNQYYSIETYPAKDCARITAVADEWGFLGNFAPAELDVNGVKFDNSEHLFQVMKFKEKGVVQNVYNGYSFGGNGAPVKMAAKSYETVGYKREDWGEMIVDVMKFCLQTKYDQSKVFRDVLEKTKGRFIVEDQTSFSKKTPDTWGVKLKGESFVGPSLLGRLLMELRENGKLDYKLPEDALDFVEFLK